MNKLLTAGAIFCAMFFAQSTYADNANYDNNNCGAVQYHGECPADHACDDQPCQTECWVKYCHYEPCYYTTCRCVEEQVPCKRRCCRYVDQQYEVTKCRYVPQYYTETACRKVPEYYDVDECKTVKKYVNDQHCKYVPRYYWKHTSSGQTCNTCPAGCR